MKILISEEDRDIRQSLIEAFLTYGKCDITLDGKECIEAFLLSLTVNEPYDIICLNIMSLRIDGLEILRAIREKENLSGLEKSKIIFTSKACDIEKVFNVFASKDEVYTSGALDKNSIHQIIERNWPDKLNIDKQNNL